MAAARAARAGSGKARAFDAVVVAAGSSTRMGAGRAKPYLKLAGLSILEWSLRAFAACPGLRRMVVVTAAEHQRRARRIVNRVDRGWLLAEGGVRRQDSVYNGLRALGHGGGVVAIHDAARPLVSPGLIASVVAAAARHGAALAAAPVVDTLKQAQGDIVVATRDRSGLHAAQTPQAFELPLVWEALRQAEADGREGTDEAALVEALGVAVRLVPAPRWNLKVTVPEDLELAGALLERRGGR